MSDEPLLRVVRGEPTAEEIAALVTAVAARASRPAPAPQTRRALWASPAMRRRRPLSPGPDSWRWSAR